MSEELQKEYEKLADLEFEYNLISKFADDEAQRILAMHKMKKQLSKIRKMESGEKPIKTSSKKKNKKKG